MRWLLLLRKFGEGGLRLHKLFHQDGGVGLYNGGKQRLFVGEIPVERTGGHPGVLHDLPQGGPKKALVQKFRQSGLLDILQGGGRFFFHGVALLIAVLHNNVIVRPVNQFVKSQRKISCGAQRRMPRRITAHRGIRV